MQTFQKDPAKFILIGDFEYQCTKKDASNTKNCRVLGKLEIFTTRKKITKIIEENPKITNKEFWKHIFSIEDNNIDFDDYYGVINYRNQLAFVDVSSIIMKYQLRLKDIYFFIGELEMAEFQGFKTPLLKAKIVIPANNVNCFLYERIVASLQNKAS